MERYKEYKSSKVYWISEVPKSWQQIKISRIFHSIGSGTTPSSGDNTFYVDEGINWLQSGDFKDNCVYSTTKKISEAAINRYGLKLYPENAIVLAMYGASIGKVGFLKIKTTVNQACCVLYDSPIMDIHYAFYSLISEKGNLIRKSKGGTQPNISQELIKGHYLAVPPLAEQKQIVRYLEDKTSKIEAYVSEKEKEILLLQELKQKTIADAVTKGLNPDVKTKDSGISWIGEIPEHWEVKRVGSFLRERKEKYNGDNTLGILSLLKGLGIIPYEEKGNIGNKAKEDLSTYKIARKGDVVVNCMNVIIGSSGITDYDGYISPAYYSFIPIDRMMAIIYKQWLSLPQMQGAIRCMAKGILEIRLRVSSQQLLSMKIPFPPLDEQRAIVSYIEEKCQKIDSLTTELQSEIDYLKEYKQRLIADCVTGQVNVQ